MSPVPPRVRAVGGAPDGSAPPVLDRVIDAVASLEQRSAADLARAAFQLRRTLDVVSAELEHRRSVLLGAADALGCPLAPAPFDAAGPDPVVHDTAAPLPDAADELGAIVAHAAAATDTILAAAEALDATATRLDPASGAAFGAHTARIFEACSFHDITGQRIGRVLLRLREIERRLTRVVHAFAPAERPPDRKGVDPPPTGRAEAIDQEAIDRLLTT